VKSLRQRLESPGRATDLFAQGPPSSKELAAAKHRLEGLLSATDEEDMGPAPADLPPAAVQPAAVAAPAVAAGVGAPAAKAGATAAAAGKAVADAVGGATATGQAAAAAGGDASELDWLSVSTWVKVEALLDEEDGLQGAEGAVAAWLAQLLPQSVP
ncbi:hypothetical protein COO60DRAFT_1540043, partial [Scenedesmus sp. NREL 46B-D3]